MVFGSHRPGSRNEVLVGVHEVLSDREEPDVVKSLCESGKQGSSLRDSFLGKVGISGVIPLGLKDPV